MAKQGKEIVPPGELKLSILYGGMVDPQFLLHDWTVSQWKLKVSETVRVIIVALLMFLFIVEGIYIIYLHGYHSRKEGAL